MPKSPKWYWEPKLGGNRLRDMRNDAKLRRLGCSVLVVWKCRIKIRKGLARELARLETLLRDRAV